MLLQYALLLLAIRSIRCKPIELQDDTRRNCGTHADGQMVEKGRYFYTCSDGSLIPAGCMDKNKLHVGIGQTYIENSYEFKCLVDNDQTLSIEFSACVIEGQKVEPGGTANNEKFWYTCIKGPENTLREEASGCVFNGKRLNRHERVEKNGYVYECKEFKTTQAIAMCPVACHNDKDNKDYDIGQEFVADKLLYICSNEGRQLNKKVIGCVTDDGHKLKGGDVYQSGDAALKCVISDSTGTLQVFGCSVDGNVKNIGAQWIEGTSPLKYSVECQERGQSVAKVRVQCIYEGDRQYRLEPGCFQKATDHNIGCKKVTSDHGAAGGLDLILFEPKQLEVASQNNLALC